MDASEFSIDPAYRRFEHPAFFNDFDVSRLSGVNVVDYNGGGVNDRLEAKFAEMHRRKFAVSMNSGTSALLGMYYGAGIEAGDEVIVPSYTFFATATPLFVLNAVPVLADCDENGNLDPQEILRLVSNRTKAVVVTHMWGVPCQMVEIAAICAENGILLLEDCSHAHGAYSQGRPVGSLGAAAAWSVGARKIISGGQGGILATDNPEIAEKAILLGHYNRRGMRDVTLSSLIPYALSGTGLNLRMHPYAAKLAELQLETLDRQILERTETAQFVLEGLTEFSSVVLPKVRAGDKPSWYAIALRYEGTIGNKGRDEIISSLHSLGAMDADAPGSTRPIASLQIFKDRARIDQFCCRRAEDYHNSLIKIPSWYGPKRFSFAEEYLRALRSVLS